MSEEKKEKKIRKMKQRKGQIIMTEYDSENETVRLNSSQKIKNRPCQSEKKNKSMQSATVTNASSSSLEDDCVYKSSSFDYKFTTSEKKVLWTSQSSILECLTGCQIQKIKSQKRTKLKKKSKNKSKQANSINTIEM